MKLIQVHKFVICCIHQLATNWLPLMDTVLTKLICGRLGLMEVFRKLNPSWDIEAESFT